MSMLNLPITLAEYAIMNAKLNEAAQKTKPASIPPPPLPEPDNKPVLKKKKVKKIPPAPPTVSDVAKALRSDHEGTSIPATIAKAPEVNIEKVLDQVIEELEKEKQPKEPVALSDQVGQVGQSANTVATVDDKTTGTKTVVVIKKSKMKKWPDNPSELLEYNDIVGPVKGVLTKGYRLFRKDEVKSFDYDGFNVGKHELQTHPSPRVRFSEQCLEYEKKSGHTLVDVILNVMFLLGVEQGRRAERHESKPVESLLETLETYRKNNKDQRIKIDELEVMLELKEKTPHLSGDEFKKRVQSGISARRAKRIEALKEELKLDESRSVFKFKTPIRLKFKELEKLARTLTKETCTEEQWVRLLE
jgi:hypothetical protein